MRLTFIVIFLTFGKLFNVFGQSNLDYYKDILEKFEFETKITSNFSDIIKSDLSILWETQNQNSILGFIGDNYSRMNIRFISVIKNKENQKEYFVYGKSKVGNNICDFQGILRLKNSFLVSVDSLKNSTGILVGEYELNEDMKNIHSGIFSGRFVTYWETDSKNNILKPDLPCVSEEYQINKFAGIWKEYKKGKLKNANWGEKRIPICGDLDVGTSEFCPNKKYEKNGWENYIKAYSGGNSKEEREKAQSVENTKWWIEND
ncbi:MAG: hypothetical protein U0W24_08315 [Bacteroidales bacterium]